MSEEPEWSEWSADDKKDERDALTVLDRNVKRFFAWVFGACFVAIVALVSAFVWR